MSRLWGRRLGLVVAPAGSGKTTLMARFAVKSGVPTAWYRCESWDVTEHQLLRHLAEAFAPLVGRACGWARVEEAVRDLESIPAARMLLVVDDAHSIEGTSAARTLERLIDYAPAGMLTLVGSRTQPGFNLSRLRVSGQVAEIGGDDLRFRSWEVESLFRDFYRDPLPPVELAELARRTEGWAAGLQLFHLATAGKGLDARRRLLRNLGGGSRIVREYLARNVLDELPGKLRAFLLDTCVLGKLSGPICDRFLNREDSAAMLEELEHRQVFTSAVGDDGDYRYHEVLRSHLEHMLVAEAGEHALNIRYGAAGRVLEQFGAIPEALHAYCRAEEWDEVDRVLGYSGARLAGSSGVWIDALPPAVLEHDPWLLLASARRHRAEGRWASAVAAYQRAEHGLTGAEVTETCRRERLALSAWLSSSPSQPAEPAGLLRQATVRDPLAIRGQASPLVGGLASLLAGEVAEADRSLATAAATGEEGDATAVAARVAAGIGAVLAGSESGAPELARASEDADAAGHGFIARLGRASLALTGEPTHVAGASRVKLTCEHIGDSWGAAMASLFAAWGRVAAGDPDESDVAALREAGAWFRHRSAFVLEAWSHSLLALGLALRADAEAQAAALKAESLANSASVEGPKVFAYAALAKTRKGATEQFRNLAAAVSARTGIAMGADAVAVSAPPAPVALSIRCFGEFQMTVNGRPIALRDMKPRTRALLRRLCADAGAPVHREVLQDALWPNIDADSASRNLHVAVSSLRHALEPGIARGASSIVVRDGEAYRISLPPGSEVDIVKFDQALERSRRARLAGEDDQAIEALELASDIASKELLPEDGSADWVVERRRRIRASLVDAVRALATRAMSNGKPDLAARLSANALAVDRDDDNLWRLLIEARRKAGDLVGAHRAESDYRRMVTELETPTRS